MAIRWHRSCSYDDAEHLAGPWCGEQRGERAVVRTGLVQQPASGMTSSVRTPRTLCALVQDFRVITISRMSPRMQDLARDLGIEVVPIAASTASVVALLSR